MLQQAVPRDYVVGTGEHHSVQEFIDVAFARAGLDPKSYVKQDPRFIRPAEVDTLRADPRKARHELGWSPSVSFEGLVHRMVDHDIELARNEAMTR